LADPVKCWKGDVNRPEGGTRGVTSSEKQEKKRKRYMHKQAAPEGAGVG